MSPTQAAPRPVAVVGAGLAGLHAAWRLHGDGIDVVVLEVRDRVGGRTWSQALVDGTVVERGGEFIAPDDVALRGLCGELGLDLIAHGFSFDRRPAPDLPAPTETEVAAFTTAAARRIAQRDADFPAAEAIAPRTPAERAAARRLETSLTVPLTVASARRMFADHGHGYDPAVRVRGGNQSVSLELARRLGARVRLGTQVVAIEHDQRGATVRCASGETVAAAAAVVAVPLPLLRELSLRPALPPAIAAAADRTAFGDAAKLHVPLAAAPRPGGVASSEALWWCWASLAPDSSTAAAPVLSSFAGGGAAVAAVGAGSGPERWTAMALRLCPDVAAAPSADPLVTHWGSQPWTRGSYSAPGVGCTRDDDAAWTSPWGSVVLAGEHTAGARSGTMNGATASGARAAGAVLELLRARSGPPAPGRSRSLPT